MKAIERTPYLAITIGDVNAEISLVGTVYNQKKLNELFGSEDIDLNYSLFSALDKAGQGGVKKREYEDKMVYYTESDGFFIRLFTEIHDPSFIHMESNGNLFVRDQNQIRLENLIKSLTNEGIEQTISEHSGSGFIVPFKRFTFDFFKELPPFVINPNLYDRIYPKKLISEQDLEKICFLTEKLLKQGFSKGVHEKFKEVLPALHGKKTIYETSTSLRNKDSSIELSAEDVTGVITTLSHYNLLKLKMDFKPGDKIELVEELTEKQKRTFLGIDSIFEDSKEVSIDEKTGSSLRRVLGMLAMEGTVEVTEVSDQPDILEWGGPRDWDAEHNL